MSDGASAGRPASRRTGGALPGAVFIDLDPDLAAPPGPAAATLSRSGRRSRRRCAAPGSAARPVVVYDGADATAAARAWWTLRYFGHAGAGPRRRATRLGRRRVGRCPGRGPGWRPAVSSPRPAGSRCSTRTAPPPWPREACCSTRRAPERYRGEVEPVDPVAGHIPGAVSAPTLGNVGVDGRFLPADLLRERFAELGATDAAEVGAYCGSGVTAAHEILALTIAGCRPRCTPARGRTGSPTPPGPWRPAADGGSGAPNSAPAARGQSTASVMNVPAPGAGRAPHRPPPYVTSTGAQVKASRSRTAAAARGVHGDGGEPYARVRGEQAQGQHVVRIARSTSKTTGTPLTGFGGRRTPARSGGTTRARVRPPACTGVRTARGGARGSRSIPGRCS